jgi:hypothetical protein
MNTTAQSYAALYKDYEDTAYLLKCKRYALWTIPSVFPNESEQGGKGNTPIQHDYQSLGSLLTNNLTTKMAEMLFPVNRPFFKINLTQQIKALVAEAGKGKDSPLGYLAELEMAACKRLLLGDSYAQTLQYLRYLVVTGNALIKRVAGVTTVYSLRNFTNKRDASGQVLDIILREKWTYGSLPPDIKVNRDGKKDTDPIIVYTRIQRKLVTGAVAWVVSQEVDAVRVGKEVTYMHNSCPYFVGVFNLVNGDDYGRGHVEEYAGDLAKYSVLSRSLTLYEVEIAKLVNCVKPGSQTTDLKSLNAAQVGEWVLADPQAVSAMEAKEYGKIQAILADLAVIGQRLSTAFMYQANQREGERVTKYELQLMVQEADKTLGGAYSRVSAATHTALAYLCMLEEQPDFMTAVIAGEATLEILTGTAALSRAADTENLLAAVQEMAAIIPILKQLSTRFDEDLIMDNILLSHGVKLDTVMLTPEKLKAKMDVQSQAAQAAAMPATTGAEAIANTQMI